MFDSSSRHLLHPALPPTSLSESRPPRRVRLTRYWTLFGPFVPGVPKHSIRHCTPPHPPRGFAANLPAARFVRYVAEDAGQDDLTMVFQLRVASRPFRLP